jgi:hypothetical protein
MLRSSNIVNKLLSEPPGWWGWTAPHPGLGPSIELPSGYPGGQRDLLPVHERLPRQRGFPEESPPPLYQIEPAGPGGNEHLVDPRMACWPLADRATAMTGEVVGDQVKITLGIGRLDVPQQGQVPGGVPGGSSQGANLAIPYPQGPVDPGLLQSSAVFQRRLDALTLGGPTGRGWVSSGYHWAQLI